MSLVEILRTKYRNTFSPIPHRSPLQFFPQLGGSIGEHCRNKINIKKIVKRKEKKEERKQKEEKIKNKQTTHTQKKKKPSTWSSTDREFKSYLPHTNV